MNTNRVELLHRYISMVNHQNPSPLAALMECYTLAYLLEEPGPKFAEVRDAIQAAESGSQFATAYMDMLQAQKYRAMRDEALGFYKLGDAGMADAVLLADLIRGRPSAGRQFHDTEIAARWTEYVTERATYAELTAQHVSPVERTKTEALNCAMLDFVELACLMIGRGDSLEYLQKFLLPGLRGIMDAAYRGGHGGQQPLPDPDDDNQRPPRDEPVLELLGYTERRDGAVVTLAMSDCGSILRLEQSIWDSIPEGDSVMIGPYAYIIKGRMVAEDEIVDGVTCCKPVHAVGTELVPLEMLV